MWTSSCLARWCVELHRLLARALAGAGIGTGTLAAHRQAAAVPDAAVATEVHQPLDVHGDLAPQVALDGELRDLRANGVDLVLGEVLDPGVRVDARGLAGGVCARPSHAIDVREPDPHVLVHRDVDAGYACHCLFTVAAGKTAYFTGISLKMLESTPQAQPCRCLWRWSEQMT